MKMFWPASVLALGCYAGFVVHDFGLYHQPQAAIALKLIGLFCCGYCAFIGKDRLLSATMLLTLGSVFIWLLADDALIGMAFFGVSMAFQFLRAARMNGFGWKALVAAGLATAAPTLVAAFLRLSALEIVGAATAALLLLALGYAACAFFRGRGEGLMAALSAGGMLLTAACAAVAVAVWLGYDDFQPWIWLLFLPSQWVLASSGLGFTNEGTVGAERRN